jgi:hypothetical protein
MADLIWKITKAKGVGSVAQVVKHLPSKCKALSRNSSTIHKKVQDSPFCIYIFSHICQHLCILGNYVPLLTLVPWSQYLVSTLEVFTE